MIDSFFAKHGPARSPATKLAKTAAGRLLTPASRRLRFRGSYASYDEAMANARPDKLAGYDNDAVTDINFDRMCEIQLWDYPVLYWLAKLSPARLLDAGGHMGTKYRAFGPYVNPDDAIDWMIHDVPAIMRAGRARAEREGLTRLSFLDDMAEAGEVDVLMASGLLQYLDTSFTDFIGKLAKPPAHLLLNKVATREGDMVVTLENFGVADVPYQIRNRAAFLAELDALGYDVVDAWTIPPLAHVIPTHLELGGSVSRGFYARRR